MTIEPSTFNVLLATGIGSVIALQSWTVRKLMELDKRLTALEVHFGIYEASKKTKHEDNSVRINFRDGGRPHSH